jgi:hypothetical protein
MVLRRAFSTTWLRAALCVVPLACGACSARRTPPPASVELTNPERRSELPVVSVFAPPDARLLPVVDTLRQELEDDFDVRVTALAAGQGGVARVSAVIEREAPRSVVLLNNSTAEIYRKWAAHADQPPIAVVLMASFAHQLQRNIPNSVGIAYEMPAVTSLVGLRGLGTRVSRVGVVYRAVFAEAIQREEQLANVEHIEFVRQELPEGFAARDLKASLVRLKRAGVDVMWLPNDNGLLTRQLVSRVWLPYLERLDLPVVVGVPSLVRSDPTFGLFAAIPDPEALAIQAADLILELSNADWAIHGPPVRLPLSAKTYASAPLVVKFGLETARLQNVDVVVGGGDE